MRNTTCGDNIALAKVGAHNNKKSWNAYQLTVVVAMRYVQRVKMINLRQLPPNDIKDTPTTTTIIKLKKEIEQKTL